MTEMSGLGIIELYRMICYCYNANSEHYGHVIMHFHPICNDFIQKGSGEK